MEELAGVTDNEIRAGAVTFKLAEPLTEPDLAVIVVVP